MISLTTLEKPNDLNIFCLGSQPSLSLIQKSSKEQWLMGKSSQALEDCVIKDPLFVICHIVNFLVNCLIRYNTEHKPYLEKCHSKFIKLKKDSMVFIYQIRDIIRKFEDRREEYLYVHSFRDCFEEYLHDYMKKPTLGNVYII